MASLTITVDDDLLKQAQAKAEQAGTCIDAVCHQALERYVSGHPSTPASRLALLRALAQRAVAGGDTAPTWPGRATLYRSTVNKTRRP